MTEDANAEDGEVAADDCNEDMDVIWEGSPLHEHLIKQELEMIPGSNTNLQDDLYASMNLNDEVEDRHVKSKSLSQPLTKSNEQVSNDEYVQNLHNHSLVSSVKSFAWPESRRLEVLQVEVARQLLESDLLVQEDEDFINNFLLTDAALEDYHRLTAEAKGASSIIGDVLLFSGSVAAVAGAVFFLSERTRAVGAAAAAALLPTALAFGTASTTRISTKLSDEQEKIDFDNLIKRLLGDMQLFKKLVRKCLNLLQGMELIHAGHVFAINSATGGPMASVPASSTQEDEQSSLSKALANRAAFPALRRAAYQCTLQLIMSYRSAVEKLMEVSPLADHIDLKDHYIAFIELKSFGIDEDLQKTMDTTKNEDISVKMLKDTVQVALVQQSEYLRRFGLVFCESVREDDEGVHHPLNKAGVLKHIRDMVETLSKINGKLSRVFDYHEAMGIDLTTENSQKALANTKKKNYNDLDFIPLRTVYTSLFSTGLHLQNSLLKVRQLEKIFDLMEKRKYEDNSNKGEANQDISPVSVKGAPSQAEIVQWLKGFEEIQGELNACVGCLEDGVSNIDRLQGREKTQSNDGQSYFAKKAEQCNARNEEVPDLPVVPLIDNDDPKQHLDEVFEAVIDNVSTDDEYTSRLNTKNHAEDLNFQRKLKSEARLMKELKSVLVEKQMEHEKREAMAVARQCGNTEHERENNYENRMEHIKPTVQQGSALQTLDDFSTVQTDACIPADENKLLQPFINEEKNNEYCELVINCNHKQFDNSATCNLQSSCGGKQDPFCLDGNAPTYDKNLSEFKNKGFEDSFVQQENNKDKLNNLENNGCINNSSALESYLQDSLKEAAISANKSLNFSNSYIYDEIQAEDKFSDNVDFLNSSSSGSQSKRKYIRHIFGEQCERKESSVIASDNHYNAHIEEAKLKGRNSSSRRSRDLPPLNIEKNYSADESESASDSASSDQGTVKLKDPFQNKLSQDNMSDEKISNSHQSKNNQLIPRSISGQVLTDEDDNSLLAKFEATEDDFHSVNDEIDNHIDSEEYSSSSSEGGEIVDENSGESDTESDTETGHCKESIEIKNSHSNQSKYQTSSYGDANSRITAFLSPFESSMTESISSSEASSFVYNENPANSYSNNSKSQVSRAALPISMTSSFCSTFCQGNATENKDQLNCSLADIRSVSTPDLKRLAIVSSTSSPYISLEDLTPKAEDINYENSSDDESSCCSDTLNESYLNSAAGEDTIDEGSIHSSTEWGSADELDHHVLKSYRRPLRPAANTSPTNVSQDDLKLVIMANEKSVKQNAKSIDYNTSLVKEKRRAKRNRNQSIIVSDDKSRDTPNNTQSNITTTKKTSPSIKHDSKSNFINQNDISNEADGKLANTLPNSTTHSVYLAQKKKENNGGPLRISLPRNPLGFDSFLASQVAQKAKNFTSGLTSRNKKEEVFGDLDSD